MALEAGCEARMTGGEPLWPVAQEPNMFYPKRRAANAGGKQAAPVNYPAYGSPSASVRCGLDTTAIELPHVETFPGAACLPPAMDVLRFSIEYIGFLSHRPKRLPSK
jgi:hypothetical protein